jgi:PAS domain S-box-containing protein
MAANDKEEEQLRSVALQNARSVLLARQRAEEELRKQSEWLRITLESIGDAVISTDADSRVTFMNGVAEGLTGWSQAEAVGRPLTDIFRIINEQTRQPVENPALRALREGAIVGLANHTVLIARDGTEHPIDDSAAPIREGSGAALGAVLVFRDVTERKRAEEIRVRLAAIVESSDDAIVSKTLEGVIRSWNAGAEHLFGYTREEAVGQPITLIIPPELHQEEQEILSRLRRGQRIEHFETVRMAKDGRRLNISLTVSPLRDEEGNIIGASKVARNVTEARRAEAALRESDEKLRLLADTIPQLAWMARPDGHIFWYNRRWYDYTGTNPEQMQGWGWQSVHDPNVLPSVLERWRGSIASGTPFDMVFPLRGADGRFRPFLTRINPLRNDQGRILYWCGTNTDISEQKRAEEASRFLADASAALAAVVDYESTLAKVARLAVPFFADWCTVHMAQPDGSLRRLAAVHGNPARIGLANEMGERYPTRPDDPYGPQHVLRTGQPEIAADVTEALLLTAARDDDHLRALRELGLRSYICVPLATRGKTLGTLTFMLAESGRRYGPADLTLARDLAHRAAVATENARLYAELREADRRKDEFIALLAHELRNPLAPLRNGLQVLRLADGDAGAVAQARAMMERQLGHMVRLIDDLLDISRISRNKMELRRSRVLLADVVSSAVETSRPVIEAAEHELIVSLPPEPVSLDADLTRLAQVFGNLLTNSAKYTERGGRIWLSAAREGDRVAVAVRDTGIGIPAYALRTIFDMFSQVDRSIERSTGGLGIGLALVKGLVEMHGGTVEAVSPGQGQGSTFTVRLPVLGDRTPRPDLAADGERSGGRPRRRILVVDDNHDAADSMAMMLRLMGNEVRTAHDGVEAVEAALVFRPQVILMDVGMPRLNGYDATQRIRQQPWGRGAIIIALTGWGQDVDRAQSKAAGCNGHLVKPVNLPDLEKLLGELEGRRG